MVENDKQMLAKVKEWSSINFEMNDMDEKDYMLRS